MMAEMKTLNGYEVVDAKAREDIEKLKAKEPDLSAYYTKTEVDAKYAAKTHKHSYNDLTDKPTIPSTAGLATEAYVDKAIAAIPEPEKVDLTGYAKEQWVKDQKYLTEHQDLSEYAKKTDIPSHEGLATESYVDDAITQAQLGGGEGIDLSDYAKKTDIPDTSKFITEIPSEYVTETELNNKGYLTEHQNLSEYAKRTEIPTKVSQLTNDSNFLTAIPGEYVTETELSAKGYLTEHQSLANYATKTFVENTVAENQPNLTKYALKTDIPDTSEFITSIPAEYVTNSELEAKGYLTEHQSLEGLATEKYVDDAIAGIELPEATGSEKIVYFYSPPSEDNINRAQSGDITLDFDSEVDEFIKKYRRGEKVCLFIYDRNAQHYYWAPAAVQTIGTGVSIWRSPTIEDIDNTAWVPTYCFTYNSSENKWNLDASSYRKVSKNIASTIYVDSLIAELEERIAALEGGNS